MSSHVTANLKLCVLLLLIVGFHSSSVLAMKSFALTADGSMKKMPAIGLGTWNSPPDQVKAAVKEAIKLGYRCFDCAAFYGNEKEIGEAFKECFDEGLVRRQDLWITSKIWSDSKEAHYVLPAIKKTIEDLQCEYLDLYLIHWPICLKHGIAFPANGKEMLSPQECPVEATWKVLEECVDAGLTHHLGVSNFSVKKIKEILACARIKPVNNQVERHPYLQQKDLVKFCRDNGITVTNYSSLGSQGRPEVLKTAGEKLLLEDPVIAEIAKKVGQSPAAVLLKWAIQEGSPVNPKSTNPDRLKANLAVGDETFELDDEDMSKIAELDAHLRYLDGKFWVFPDGPYKMEDIWDG